MDIWVAVMGADKAQQFWDMTPGAVLALSEMRTKVGAPTDAQIDAMFGV